tara:strand:+ start:85 stop:318 length:234 start_codon:yes stop_codon:yes gene_type:complete
MLNRDELNLLVGLIIAMFIVWLTLPTEKDRRHNEECVEFCKQEIMKGNTGITVHSSHTYFRAMTVCYEECAGETIAK